MLDAQLQPLARQCRAKRGLSCEESREATQVALSTIVLALLARLQVGEAPPANASQRVDLTRSRALRRAFLLTYDWRGWMARIVQNEHATIARRHLTPLVDASCLLIPIDDQMFETIVARAAAFPGVTRSHRQQALTVETARDDLRRKATLARGRPSRGPAELLAEGGARVIATFSTPRDPARMAEILPFRDRGRRTSVLVVPDDPRRRGRRVDDAGRLVPVVEIYENDVCVDAQIKLGNRRHWRAVLVGPRRDARAQIDQFPDEHLLGNAAQERWRLEPSIARVIAFVADLPVDRNGYPSNRRRVAIDLLALCPEVHELAERCLRATPGRGQLADEIALARVELSRIPRGLETRGRIALHILGEATKETTNNVSQVRSQLTGLVRSAGFAPDPSDGDPEDPELIYGWAWLLERVW